MTRVDLAVLTGLLALALLRPLTAPPIVLYGEAREGLVVQDIVDDGDWLLPRRNGALPSKPPFYHWIAAAAGHVVGLSDPVVRLPSAIAAWVMTVATFVAGVALGGRLTGWLAVGALWGTATFWLAAAQARVDMVFSACVTTALVGFFLWLRGGGWTAQAACWLATALAVLTKGPAGAVLVALVVVGHLLLGRDLRRLRALWSWPLVAASGALVAGWYGAAIALGGREFVSVQLLTENLDRLVGQGQFAAHRFRNPFRMEVVLLTHLLPWNLALAWAGWRWWRGERPDPDERFLHVWWATVLAVFTLAAGKRGIYLLPLYPPVALLAARMLARVVPVARRRRLAIGIVAFDLVLLVTTQVVREYVGARKSLVAFATDVAGKVPRGQVLRASGLPPTDLWVMAYRLRRPIRRSRLRCRRPMYYLVPITRTRDLPVLAVSSRRKGVDVALVRCPQGASRSRNVRSSPLNSIG